MFTNQRFILHLDLDAFYVSVEQLRDSRLKGHPVIIGGNSERGVVASCSYEARAFGVHSAMPMKEALRKCPEAIVIKGDMSLYSYYSQMVTAIVKEQVPLFEKSSVDEFYADLTGMDRFFGCLAFAKKLRNKIARDSGLPNSFGLSRNKTVSKIATGEAKPNGIKHIRHGEEQAFLDPLPVRKIPMVGKKTDQVLRAQGVEKIQQLREMTPEHLQKLLGNHGLALWKRAQGIDHAPVISYHEAKSISSERTFGEDASDSTRLLQILSDLTEQVAHELREDGKLTACVAIKLRYANFETVSKQKHIPYSASDHQLIPIIHDLFRQLHQPSRKVRLLGVRFSDLVKGSMQLNLFTDTDSKIALYQAIDQIKRKHGKDKMRRGGAM